MSARQKVKIAMIGCGGISKEHVKAHLACPGSELLYCVDIDQDKAKEKAATAKSQWHTDYRAVLDEVDAVDICTPPHAHAEIAVEAARRGKHVLTEKVMARTLPEARWMIDEAEKSGIIFMVAFCVRYWPGHVLMHDICASGGIGEPLQAYYQSQMGLPFRFPNFPAQWRRNPYDFPMGCFLSHGCHYVDQLQWAVGRIVEVNSMSHAKTLAKTIPGGDDTSSTIFRHENGAVSAYCESWAIPYPIANTYEIYGTKGSIKLDGATGVNAGVLLTNADGTKKVVPPDTTQGQEGGHAMNAEIAHFVSCIQNKKQPFTNGREGIKPMQVILAAEAAEREGRTINVEEFANRPENTKPWNEAEFRAWVEEKYHWPRK